MKFSIFALVVASLTLPSPVLAQYRTVFSSIAALRATGTAPTYVDVSCYYDLSTGRPCTGGGTFYTVPGATCADNGLVIEQTALPHACYFRDDFGVNGVVDARQCGVVGDGVNDDAVALQTCINAAASLTNVLGAKIVTTGGGVILDNSQIIQTPDNVILTCGGNSMLTADNSDYRIFKSNGTTPNLTHAIVIDPTVHDGGYYTLALAGNNSGLIGCTVEAGAGTPVAGVYPNPYSPSRWYPGCDHTSGTCTDNAPANLRAAIDEYSAFNRSPTADYSASGCGRSPALTGCGPASNNVGITASGQNVLIRNVTVLGFGTCLAGGGSRLVVDTLSGDCWLALNLKTPDMPVLRDCSNGGLLASDPFRTIYR